MAIDTSFLKQLDRFNLILQKRVTSDFIGQKKSKATGRGLIFADHRVYAPGDDIRGIDWKVYARTDDYFTKNYEEERNLVVHVIMDVSASMDFGQKIKKHEYASMLALGFAYLATKNNEKVKFATFSEDLQLFSGGRGKGMIAAMLRHVEGIKPEGKSSIDTCLSHYRKMFGSKSMVVLISDFLINIEEIKKAFIHLGKHQMKIVQILDPIEKNLGFNGECDFIDSETGMKMKSWISPRVRNKFQAELESHSSKLGDIIAAMGGEFYQFTSDKDIFECFFEMLR